ncbi:MAG: hypothetical protein PVJ57_01900 [Phycisphaerae bacterium]|jgi:hypothetical protein
MHRWLSGLCIVLAVGFALLFLAGCQSHERRKVTVIEEQQEGEVHEEPQGEMIVE